MTKKLFIKTYGCQMNVYDSGRMADVLAPADYELTEAPEGADLIILNTCHIREKAAEKIYSELGRLRALKENAQEAGRSMLIGVGGCVAQAEGEEMVRRAPYVDLVFGPQTYHRLGDMVTRAAAGTRVVETEFPEEPKFDSLPVTRSKESGSKPGNQGTSAAFLSVQEGCDKFCTFCVVPYTRGTEYSRPVSDILDEARTLIAAGAVEITLLGQNVNAYHGIASDGSNQEWGFGRLIRSLAELKGLARIRYTTSHPRDMDDDLINAHREIKTLMPYLHLPVQSGSDRILTAMNRGYGVDEYFDIVAKLRDALPDIALSSDFIVGFPGETDDDFKATLDLVEKVGYAQAYSFKYSARPGTPAASLDDQVPEPVKAERLARLQKILGDQSSAFNAACVGKTFPVLFDRPGRYQGQVAGRSPYLQAVNVSVTPDDGSDVDRIVSDLFGTIRNVTITESRPNSLKGALVDDPANNNPADHPLQVDA
ncbi:MAG: tRNA (N6-isopentenyl adenosine(37)-C2)-methylthiotransferase MiaB [Rhodospirillales bacterium]|nr:tRNA (N6-isopentenyl adenosine(37)-C2)-methylthiotransferase MiaB [Rhodospirillales bacterium]MBT4005553.1 tRNA (N6-isopentenyl adenosine(37)-C2)-methylthiotransferase MiaB [Rhodospirillales bacterium]MBT5076301.1 tRNA (N6-isopentenyl adenosine(37)-C2)-methylthiotransferase MiaB [Rhodospirillales bacterium]MBT5112272.1 tRNA (N6-isopentenyl adenosine(37)-C2)-methylthiotransferase MiaB [Rhodospirillales bacterium]MBT5671973.1 tRNA (N6-isopentenyl adenosine(37)-C2)-methylthiotransferase MiaB [R